MKDSCRHEAAHLVRDVRRTRYFWCDECASRVTKHVTGHPDWALPHDHTACAHLSDSDIPLHQFGTHRRCEHCNTTAQCEAHHMAPQSLFVDAGSWPLVYLCRGCHHLWHDVVTPYMPGHTNPVRLAEILLRWVPADVLAETVAIMRAMRAREKAA